MTLWDGLPPDPVHNGWHWIGPRTAPFPAEWQAATRTWVWAYGRWLIPAGYVPPQVAQVVAENPNAWAYHGSCQPPQTKPTPEDVARAICKAMNINPDGYNAARKFRAVQHRMADGAMETVPNWRAAEHVAQAAMEAMVR